MKSRNLIALAIAMVVAAGAWQVTQRKAPTTEFAAALLYPGLIDHLNDSQQIVIGSSTGTVTVVHAGDQWRVKEFDGYPAQVATIKQLLVQLASLKILEIKTGKPEKYPQLGVEDLANPGATSRAVKVIMQSGSTAVDLLVGKEHPARAMNPSRHYVRRVEEASAYLVEGDLSFGSKPTEWLETSVVNLPVERVRQVTIQPTNGPAMVVNKARPDVQLYTLANVPDGFEVRALATVSSMGGLLLDAKFEKVALASKLVALTPVAVATVETFDGITAKVAQFKFEDAAYLTFEFAHTPSIVVTPPPATAPAEKTTVAPSSPAAPPPAPLKSAVEVAQEVVTLNARVNGWAYVLPDYKSRLFDKKLADLLKKKAPPGEPAAARAKK